MAIELKARVGEMTPINVSGRVVKIDPLAFDKDGPYIAVWIEPDVPPGCRLLERRPDGSVLYQRFEPMGGGWAT